MLALGPNGSGKSTLLRALAGSLSEYERGTMHGRLLRDGSPPVARDVALLPQDSADALTGNSVLSEITVRLSASGVPAARVEAASRSVLLGLGLGDRGHQDASKLSEGERRRLMLEACLVTRPSLLLLDEPLDHVDARWQRLMRGRIEEAAASSLVVVATHRPELYEDLGVQRVRVGQPTARTRPVRPPEVRALGTPRVSWSSSTVERGGRVLFRSGPVDLGPGLHVVTGPNGCGKTTWLRALFGFHPLARGSARVGAAHASDGPEAVARHAVLLFENPSGMFFRPTAHEEVAFGLQDESGVAPAIAFAGLDGLAAESPFRLSGGQRERLALAIVASRSRPVVLLDEPTHGLDDDGLERLLLLVEAWRESRCLLVATHDQRIVRQADTRLRIDHGVLEVVR